MFLLVDNYDSFTYNLYALFKNHGAEVKVIKNSEYIPAEPFEGIILSPGPSTPQNSGTTLQYLKNYTGIKPIFGVCLGMQSIGYHLGYNVGRASTVKHGKLDQIEVGPNSILFEGLPEKINVVRYHSLAVEADSDMVTSVSCADGAVMSIEDREKKLFGVQFHPESILSEYGGAIVQNFLKFVKKEKEKMEQIIGKVNLGKSISFDEARAMFEAMISGTITEAQIASALISLRHRGETDDELAALAMTLNNYKKTFSAVRDKSIDTCGTGGDGKSTVNVSTAVSVILSSMGYNVVKHGNSAQSGKVGSADILTDLGFDLEYKKSSPDEFYSKNNYIFMMAPLYHPSLKGIGKIRRELKVPTIFNFVGPLVNPADPEYQVIGISRREKLDFYAGAVLKLGKNNVTVYSSFDGYDEVSSKDKTECLSVKNGSIERFYIEPSDFFEPFDMPTVYTKNDAKMFFLEGLTGQFEKITNLFALNTALALKTMDEYDMESGYKAVREHILSGGVKGKLSDLFGYGKNVS